MNGAPPGADATPPDVPAKVAADARPVLGRRFRLQYEPAQAAHVLLYPEGMIKLNGSAAEILKRCDGTATIEAITLDLERAFGVTGLAADVAAFVSMAVGKHWLALAP
jgi:pyrroloquinoline quinone biosynthesis protein D